MTPEHHLPLTMVLDEAERAARAVIEGNGHDHAVSVRLLGVGVRGEMVFASTGPAMVPVQHRARVADKLDELADLMRRAAPSAASVAREGDFERAR